MRFLVCLVLLLTAVLPEGAHAQSAYERLLHQGWEEAKAGCDRGDQRSCFAVGMYLKREQVTTPNGLSTARALLGGACDAGIAEACSNAGEMLKDGIGGSRDVETATRRFRQACDMGIARSCYEAADLLADPEGPFRNPQEARLFYRKGCYAKTDTPDEASCVMLSEYLIAGNGGPPAHEEARKVLTMACNQPPGSGWGGSWSCKALGRVLEEGIGGPVDLPGARKAYSEACQGSWPEACGSRDRIDASGKAGPKPVLTRYWPSTDPAEYARREQLCRKETDEIYCNVAARHAFEGRGTARDPARAREFLRLSCEGNRFRSWACAGHAYMLAEGIGGPADPVKARELYRMTCLGAEFGRACLQYADMLSQGIGGPKAPVKDIATALQAGCRSGSQWLACVALGNLVADPARKAEAGEYIMGAYEAYEQACRYGAAFICREMALAQKKNGQDPRSVLERACNAGHLPSCKEGGFSRRDIVFFKPGEPGSRNQEHLYWLIPGYSFADDEVAEAETLCKADSPPDVQAAACGLLLNSARYHGEEILPWLTVRLNMNLNRGDARPMEMLGDLNLFLTYRRGNVNAHYVRSNVLLDMKEYRAALADADVLLALKPEEPLYLNHRCWVRAMWGQELDQALADCDKGLALAPTDAAILDSRGVVRLKRGEFQQALADFDTALANDADGVAAHHLYGRGIALARLGRAQEAETALRRAREEDAGVAAAYAGYGLKP